MKLGLAASLLLLGCKYGGSEQDPLGGYEPGEPMEVVSIDASSPAEEPGPKSTPGRSDGGSAPSATPDAGPPVTKPSNPGACGPATPAAVCDPVRNTGCPPIPLMQCDADTTATVPTGRCSIFTPTPIVPCSSTTTASSTACLPQTTCVKDACRKLCDCDADCEPGQTCSEAAGAFKLCK